MDGSADEASVLVSAAADVDSLDLTTEVADVASLDLEGVSSALVAPFFGPFDEPSAVVGLDVTALALAEVASLDSIDVSAVLVAAFFELLDEEFAVVGLALPASPALCVAEDAAAEVALSVALAFVLVFVFEEDSLELGRADSTPDEAWALAEKDEEADADAEELATEDAEALAAEDTEALTCADFVPDADAVLVFELEAGTVLAAEELIAADEELVSPAALPSAVTVK